MDLPTWRDAMAEAACGAPIGPDAYCLGCGTAPTLNELLERRRRLEAIGQLDDELAELQAQDREARR